MIRRLSVMLGASILLLSFVPSRGRAQGGEPEGYGKQLGVIIGINYGGTDNAGVSAVPPLKNAENDATALYNCLVVRYGYDGKPDGVGGKPGGSENVRLLRGPEATKDKIDAALSQVLGRAEEVDSVLIYYSGHGERGVDPRGNAYATLVPYDAKTLPDKKTLDPFSCFDFDELIRQKVKMTRARHTLILLDCCYSGQLLATTRGDRSLRIDLPMDAKGFRARGVQGMTAGLAKQRVPDGQGDHSPFTKALLDAFGRLPAKNARWRGVFTADFLFSDVQDGLAELRRTQGLQPLFGNLTAFGDGDEANFHFFPTAEAMAAIAQEPPAAPRESLKFDLPSMTGLNGQWWFEETPWLVPALRGDLALDGEFVSRRLEPTGGAIVAMRGPGGTVSAFLNPDVEKVHALLRDTIRQKRWLDGREDPSAQVVRDLLEDGEALRRNADDYIRRLIDVLQAGEGEGEGKAADWHLLAVLQHKLNVDEAEGSYRKARAAYEAETPRRIGLLALCRSDLARWYLLKKRYDDAIVEYSDAEKLIGEQPTAFYLDCLCNRGEAHRRKGDWPKTQQCSAKAEALAAAYLQPNHPLRAFVLEKAAWADFELWRIGPTIERFEKALQVFGGARETAGLGVQARITRLRILHGRAMAERFAGDPAEARRRFEEIGEEIASLMRAQDEGPKLTQVEQQSLADRRVNTIERQAETYLHVGQHRDAAEILDGALELAQNLPLDRRESTRYQLHLKRAIARALDKDPVAARKALKLAGEQRLVLNQFKDLQVFQEAAEALVEMAEAKGASSGLSSSIGQFLERTMGAQTGDFPDPVADLKTLGNFRRDDLELLLLVNLHVPRYPMAHRNVERLLNVVQDNHDAKVRGYTRHYYDAVIRDLIRQNNAENLVRWVFFAKCGEDNPEKRYKLISKKNVLLLHAGRDWGLAILSTAGGQRKVYPLSGGLDAWRARTEGRPLTTPWHAELAEALAKLEGEILIFWGDPVVTEMDQAHFPFAQDPRFKSQLLPYPQIVTSTIHDVARPASDKFTPALDANSRP